MTDKTTLVDPAWRLCSGRRTIDGVLFISYSIGILHYTQVSEDGKIRLRSDNHGSSYSVEVLGHGVIHNDNGGMKNFRTFANAARAGIKVRNRR